MKLTNVGKHFVRIEDADLIVYYCRRCHGRDELLEPTCNCVLRDWAYGIFAALFVVIPGIVVTLHLFGILPR